jgi:hypothetical protein
MILFSGKTRTEFSGGESAVAYETLGARVSNLEMKKKDLQTCLKGVAHGNFPAQAILSQKLPRDCVKF